MTRTISRSMAGILEELELNNATYIDSETIAKLADKYNVRTKPAVIISRLKEAGWLIPTLQRGIWEFAPAAFAGSYSRNDALGSVKAFLTANSDISCFLCGQTAAWALGIADRVPLHKELAFLTLPKVKTPDDIWLFRYEPNIDTVMAKELPCLAPESIMVQLNVRPGSIRSWGGISEWLPDLIYEINITTLLKELEGRPDSVKRRTGYLIQSMYPEAAAAIAGGIVKKTKIRFGTRGKTLRNDENWLVADTILPFDPREMERVK